MNNISIEDINEINELLNEPNSGYIENSNDEFFDSDVIQPLQVNGYPYLLNFPVTGFAIGLTGFFIGPLVGSITSVSGLFTGLMIKKYNIYDC